MNRYAITCSDDVAQAMPPPASRESIRTLQRSRGEEPCFQTDLRYLCENAACEWRRECRRLVAEWRR